MPKRPDGHVFIKVDLPEDLYVRFQKACEALTGRPRSVSYILRESVKAILDLYEVEKDADGNWPETDRDTLAS